MVVLAIPDIIENEYSRSFDMLSHLQFWRDKEMNPYSFLWDKMPIKSTGIGSADFLVDGIVKFSSKRCIVIVKRL